MTGFRNTRTAEPDVPLDPAVAAELAALDRALAGEPIDDAQLAALVRDVQAAAPVMDGDARAELNERFAAPAPARRRAPRLAAVGSGALATVLVGAIAVTALQPRDRFTSDTPSVTALSGEAGSEAPASAEDSAAGLPAGGPTGNERFNQAAPADPATVPESTSAQRRVERSASLQLRVKRAELTAAARRVEELTRAAGGYVASSELDVASGAGRTSEGRFTLRVPSAKLDDTLGRIGGLGMVTDQRRTSDDITAQSDSADQRLRDAERERQALLRALARAEKPAEVSAVRRQLDDNRRLRATLRGEVTELKRRSDLATVTLTLTTATGDEPLVTDEDGGWGIGDAADDASRTLDVLGGALLLTAAVLAPFALLGAVGWGITRRRRRALRDAALG